MFQWFVGLMHQVMEMQNCKLQQYFSICHVMDRLPNTPTRQRARLCPLRFSVGHVGPVYWHYAILAHPHWGMGLLNTVGGFHASVCKETASYELSIHLVYYYPKYLRVSTHAFASFLTLSLSLLYMCLPFPNWFIIPRFHQQQRLPALQHFTFARLPCLKG